MIDKDQINEIVGLYAKHGWNLRRVLLSEALRKRIESATPELFGDAEVRDSDIDGAWFARSSRPGDETWELRRLSPDAFAVCEVFSEDDDDVTREEAMFEMEERLRG